MRLRRAPLAWAILLLSTARAAAAPSDPARPLAGGSDGGLARVRTAGELRWALDAQGGAPYAFQDPTDPNRLIGFEVELAAALAQKLGVRARPVQGPWAQLIELTVRGDADIALNGLEATDDKKKVCRLSRAYYVAPERLTVRRGDARAPRSLAALSGRRAGTLPGSLAERILARAGAEVRTYEGGQDDIYKDLELGRIDAVLLDAPATRYYGELDGGFEQVDGDFGEVRYAIALPPDERALGDALDAALSGLAADGTLRAIYQRWGLWNRETAALLGDARPSPGAVAEGWEAWRAAVGQQPPFTERLLHRYPRLAGAFARSAGLTLVISLLAMALAVALGLVLALARTYGPAPVRWLAVAYIEVVRGTPLLVQLTMIYFGLPELGLKLQPLAAGVLALGLNYAAAEAENYRAGLESVPLGQREAAATLGLSRWQTIVHVVAPQALRVALPPSTNDFIALLKDSSLVALVTLTELTKTYLNLASATRDHLGLGLVVAVVYLLLGLPFARLARYTEARMAKKLRRAA